MSSLPFQKTFRSMGFRLLKSRALFDAYLRRSAPYFSGAAPDFVRANRALQDFAELDLALGQGCRLGVPLHADWPKNWDTLTALTLTLQTVRSKSEPILDAGGTMYGAFLKTLYLYGFQNLKAVNLEFKGPRRLGPIRYLPGDITKLPDPDGHFAVAFCQSVVEHGVPLAAYFREMARVIKPGGLLITSTDYWDPKLKSEGMKAYGADVRVFCAQEIRDMLVLAAESGWEPISEPDFRCDQPVVKWRRLGLDFTFYTLALRRTAG